MKVLSIVNNLNMGGTQRVAQNITIELKKQGVDIALLVLESLGPRAEAINQEAIPIFGPVTEKSASLEIALRWKPDIVHIHRFGGANSQETALLRAFRTVGAYIVETNVFALSDPTIGEDLIDVHCHLSQWQRLKWNMASGNRRRVATVVPNAVDIGAFAPISVPERSSIRLQLGVPPGRFLYGRIGQPSEAKWMPDIFELIQQACEEGRDVGLLLVGAPERYQVLVKYLPNDIQDRIIFTAPVHDDVTLSRYYSAMDAFLHLSRIGESFGMVLCEAMLCGVPVISLSTPYRDNSQIEVVGLGGGGLIAANLQGIREAMERLESDPSLRTALSHVGRQSVIERYAVPVIVRQFRDIYSALMQGEPIGQSKSIEQFGIDQAMSIHAQSLGSERLLLTRIGFILSNMPLAMRVVRAFKNIMSR